jgi:amino acid adenylation domain-containing protein
LRRLAETTGTTTFDVVMAAVNLLLARLSDQEDVVVGFPVANRPDPELARIVGPFGDTAVLRTGMAGRPSFTQLLRQVGADIRVAREHQAAMRPLLAELPPAGARGRQAPPFRAMLVYPSDPSGPVSFPDMAVEVDELPLEANADCPLVFAVRDEGDAMRLELAYSPDLFAPRRADLMLRQLAQLLDQVAHAPDNPVTAYSVALGDVHPGVADLVLPLAEPGYEPVPDLIAEQAASSPSRIAITHGTDEISYAALVSRAEALARHLRATGHGTGEVIAVTGPRGIGFVVALLGVLRSGAIMLPIDPALPEGRRRHLLAIGKPTMVVRVEPDESSFPATPSLPVIAVDARTGLLPTTGAGDPDATGGPDLPPVSAQSPAYLFFTSGTTGTPRGVLGWHGALSHFLCWQRGTFAIGPADRCAQTTSASFDVMLRDTFLALVSGATLVVPRPSDQMGGRAVFRWLVGERVTVLHTVPTVLETWLLDAPPDTWLPDLRWTFFAGEPLTASLVEAFRSICSSAGEIVNLYGPTETTMAKFAYRVPRRRLPPVLPVGSPLPETQGFVLRDGVVCGVGEPGEIVIRTPFRTRGYYGDPAATAAAFFANPYRSDDRDLLYHSGDIGRYRPDGSLEIIGRADRQVKINGLRIQPAEIEDALTRHPEVSACLVVADRDPGGDIRLVAYVVASGAGLAERLRAHLTNLLPRTMVPAHYETVDRIPMTPNGKPDRAALPKPRFHRDGPADFVAPPRTAAERAIGDAWSTVLDRSRPGIHDDFFHLGGTSLQLLRLFALLDERFPSAFRVAQLFSHPTIAQQAALVEAPSGGPDGEVTEHEL